MKKILQLFVVGIPLMILVYFGYTGYVKMEQLTYNHLMISEVMTKNLTSISDVEGEYCDWIELYNPTDMAISLKGYSLSDSTHEANRWYFPDIVLAEGEYLVVWMSGKDTVFSNGELHTSFLLNSSKETITLYSEKNKLVDEIVVADMEWDISYGRKENVVGEEGYFIKATPGYTNTSILTKRMNNTDASLLPVEFSVKGGFYEEAFLLELLCEDEEAVIYYTLDGSEPDITSQVYKEPLLIKDATTKPNKWSTIPCVTTEENNVVYGVNNVDKCTTIRARTYKNGKFAEKIETQSYFIGLEYTLPVISITADPERLFNEKDGAYMPGETYWLANELNLAQKKACVSAFFGESISGAIEIFGTNKSKVFSDEIDLAVTGGASRATEVLKGFTVECISQNEILKLKATGGGSSYTASYQNYFLNKVAADWGIALETGDFYILFLDGEYWGIYYTQNKISAANISREKQIDSDNLYIVKSALKNAINSWQTLAGGNDAITELEELYFAVLESDFTKDNEYQWITECIDIENFADYILYNIYVSNGDWLTNHSNNIVIYRSINVRDGRYSDGKWRWLIQDMDSSLAAVEPLSIEECLGFDQEAIDETVCIESRHFTNLLLTKLWENHNFRELYRERFYEFVYGFGGAKRLLDAYNAQTELIKPEMEKNLLRQARDYTEREKWERRLIGENYYYKNLYMEEWLINSTGILNFLMNRVETIENELIKYE